LLTELIDLNALLTEFQNPLFADCRYELIWSFWNGMRMAGFHELTCSTSPYCYQPMMLPIVRRRPGATIQAVLDDQPHWLQWRSDTVRERVRMRPATSVREEDRHRSSTYRCRRERRRDRATAR
jgi:hypothetical protein